MSKKKSVISVKPPKYVRTEYRVTTILPDTYEYSENILCKNFTEAKRTYKELVNTNLNNILVTCLMTVNKLYKNETKSSDMVLACTQGRLKNG